MQIAFEAWFDHAGLDHELVSDEIFRYLNEAQDEIVEQMFSQFEQDSIVTDDLRVLVEKDKEIDALYIGANAGINGFNADYATFPSNYQYLIAGRVQVKYNVLGVTIDTATADLARTITGSSTEITVLAKISQSDDIYRLLLDPFNRTSFRTPIGVINGSRLIVYTDSKFICEKFFIDYIRRPIQISYTLGTDCELPTILHRTVVDRAIDRFVQRTSLLSQPNSTT